MSFLAPFAGWFLLALPVIVLLYLRRQMRRPATVSSLFFWEQVLREHRPRALWQRLRQLLSLLLHLLIFLLIAAALAKPVLSRFATSAASTVLVLDTRARMQAREADGQTRFEKAVRLAGLYAAAADDRREMALLTAGDGPEVVTPFTADRELLVQSLRTAHATEAPGALDASITLARQLLAARKGSGEVVVLTDAAPANSPLNVHFISVGTPRENVAITQFGARAVPSSPQTSALYLELANFGAKPARGSLEIALDGQLLDVQPYQLAPGQRLQRSLSATPVAALNARGWLTAKLDQADSLPLDNEAFVVLPPPAPARVLVVTKGNLFLEKALASNELIRSEMLAPESYRPELATAFDVVIFDRFVPANFQLASAKGNFLFLRATPFPQTEMSAPPVVSDADAASPLLRLVDLRAVTFLRAAALQTPIAADGWKFETPLRSLDQPLIVTGERPLPGGSQRIAAFAFDLAETDLPLRVAFPLLINNTVQWLSGAEAGESRALLTGATQPLPSGATIWNAPQRTANPLPAQPQPLVKDVFQPQAIGFYLEPSATSPRWLAANLFNEAESNLQHASSTTATALPDFAGAIWWRWPLWMILALAAFALFTLEWWLYHRRHTE